MSTRKFCSFGTGSKYTFDKDKIEIPDLCDSSRILQIDSKVLREAELQTEAAEVETIQKEAIKTEITETELVEMEIAETKVTETEERLEEEVGQSSPKLSKKKQAEHLRKMVDTVGKEGRPGEQVQNVISVGMLSEGWDAKTVTHIMGIRAFSSQLLCEQVVGRGLRRVSYELNKDGLFEAEYVNIFGVPFTFLPHEDGGDGPPPPPPLPKTAIHPVKEKVRHKINWPNVVRIDLVYRSTLIMDWDKVDSLTIDPHKSITEAELNAIIAGKPHTEVKKAIGLEKIARDTRVQTIVFKIASQIYNAKIYNTEKHNTEEYKNWKGGKEILLAQLLPIVTQFIESNKICIQDEVEPNSEQGAVKRKVLIILNMTQIIRHVWQEVKIANSEKRIPIFDREKPIRSTGDMRTWYTSKPCEWAEKSHINYCVYDSGWEASEAYILDRSNMVDSFVKNDHLGFFISYIWQGVFRKYYPDFLIRLKNGQYMILETKGREREQDKIKRNSLDEWVKAVNDYGGLGDWRWAVSYRPSDVELKLRI